MQDALAVVSLGYHEFLGKAWPLVWPRSRRFMDNYISMGQKEHQPPSTGVIWHDSPIFTRKIQKITNHFYPFLGC